MTVLALVVGAAILLTWMLVHSYSGRDRRGTRPTHATQHSDGGDIPWMFFGSDGGSDASAGDCSAGDSGGGCGGDGGGDGGGGGD